jgi:hypothetical protein
MEGEAMTTYLPTRRWRRTAAVALAAASVAVAASATGAARADDVNVCSSSTGHSYELQLRALTGPAGADVTLAVDSAAGCTVPDALKKVQLKTLGDGGAPVRVRNLVDVAARDGAVTLDLGQVPRDRRIEVEVLVQTAADGRTHVLRGATTTLLRPDLVVSSVDAPAQTLVTRPVDVHAVVAEVNGDVGADATVTLVSGSTVYAGRTLHVPKGARVPVDFPGVALAAPKPVELTVHVADVAPGETDSTNNARDTTVDVTEHELARSRLVLSSFGGYGAQFNQHLYAPISGLSPEELLNAHEKVKALQPGLVRIFYNDIWEENRRGDIPDWRENMASFFKVVQLAQETGATINITFHTYVFAVNDPEASMARFAQVLDDLVRVYGLTNVRWVTIGNEPNGGNITLEQYNALYRALNAQLVARGLRDQIHLMGGDLVESAGLRDHHIWLKWIADNMSDILDAYSEHIYWWYDLPGRMEYRLRDTAQLVNRELPESERRPTYLMEFGIRGYTNCGNKPAFLNLYYSDCTEIWRTNIAAFQQLWFNVEAGQLGFAGTSKWDAYWALYDRSSAKNQSYWMTGPASEHYPLTPTYHAMRLIYQTTARGWHVLGVDPWTEDDWANKAKDVPADQPEKEIAAYAGPNGQLTLIGLDTHGAGLNTLSLDAPEYSIGGLPPSTTFNLELWNAAGDGKNSPGGTITTNAAGVARFQVPLQAAFALTTVAL